MLYHTLAFQQLRFFVWAVRELKFTIQFMAPRLPHKYVKRVIWLYSKTRGGHSHDVSKMEPQIFTRGQMGAIFYIYSISTIFYCFLVIDLCYFYNRCIVYWKKWYITQNSLLRAVQELKFTAFSNM